MNVRLSITTKLRGSSVEKENFSEQFWRARISVWQEVWLCLIMAAILAGFKLKRPKHHANLSLVYARLFCVHRLQEGKLSPLTGVRTPHLLLSETGAK